MEAVETRLSELRLGVVCWVEIKNSGEAGKLLLGYEKVGGHWGLEIAIEGKQQWPFNKAPRRLKSAAVEGLLDLLIAMTSAAETMTEKLHAATKTVKSIVEAVHKVEIARKEAR